MKLSLAIFGLFAGAFALPSQLGSQNIDPRQNYQTAHLRFNGGPASYSMAVVANGVEVVTNNALSISIIDANDYNAFYQCTFKTDGQKTLVQSIDTSDGSQHIIVGPPQPIRSVTCYGMCVPTYSSCYGTNGQYIGPCCNGYCAATKCRPWKTN